MYYLSIRIRITAYHCSELLLDTYILLLVALATPICIFTALYFQGTFWNKKGFLKFSTYIFGFYLLVFCMYVCMLFHYPKIYLFCIIYIFICIIMYNLHTLKIGKQYMYVCIYIFDFVFFLFHFLFS